MKPWTQIQRDRLDELKDIHQRNYWYDFVWWNYWRFSHRFVECLGRRLK